MMPIPDKVPKIETIEEYYERNGIRFTGVPKEEDAEITFYKRFGRYAQ